MYEDTEGYVDGYVDICRKILKDIVDILYVYMEGYVECIKL